MSVATGSFPSALASGDFDGDGRLDFAVANAASNTVAVFLGRSGAAAPLVAGLATTLQAT